MKLQYVAVLIFLNSEATQYWPLSKPVVVKVEVKKIAEQSQNGQVPCSNLHFEQPQAITMEKAKDNENTGLRNRKNKYRCEPKPETSSTRPQPINRAHPLGLFSLFFCASQPGDN
ncbi:MAG TPA: hypothetical protein VHO47_04095 [Candidatus Babeliales bacterium]|nr:hypothetical protein [Candidatus Babeliales bacterium]